MNEKLMISIPLDDYTELVKTQERLSAVVNYVASHSYSVDKKMVYVLSGRPELIEED